MKSLNRILRVCAALAAGWALALPAAAEKAPRGVGLDRVVESRLVRLQEPMSFWQGGKKTAASDLVLLRVKVLNAPALFGKDITPPLFFYGDAVCDMVKDPDADGETLLLAPAAAGASPTLWLSGAGLLPERVDAKAVARLRKAALKQKTVRSLPVVLPKDAPAPDAYKNISDLRRRLAPPPKPAGK